MTLTSVKEYVFTSMRKGWIDWSLFYFEIPHIPYLTTAEDLTYSQSKTLYANLETCFLLTLKLFVYNVQYTLLQGCALQLIVNLNIA